MEIHKKLIDVLVELRNASLSIKTEDDLKTTMKKYNMIFFGEKLNKINSIELKNTLKTHFNIELTNNQLLEYLPAVCESLDMQIEGLQRVDEPGKTTAYFITLFWFYWVK